MECTSVGIKRIISPVDASLHDRRFGSTQVGAAAEDLAVLGGVERRSEESRLGGRGRREKKGNERTVKRSEGGMASQIV